MGPNPKRRQTGDRASSTARVETVREGRKLRRADKAENNRKALLRAAVQVIGERGYNEASVARITERANVAAGTFYRHFESRQAMFDELLPGLARGALDFIIPHVHGSADLLELEERGLRAMLEWEKTHSGLTRVRNEAETSAPAAFEKYLTELLSRYVRALKRGQSQGYLEGYSDAQLRVVACMLIGARHYLHYVLRSSGKRTKHVVDAYLSFVSGGLRSKLRKDRGGKRAKPSG
jgi:AcrR family transcriptional regulator